MLFVLKGNAQNLKMEIKYLQIVNSQSKELIKDNVRNAEITAFKIINRPDSFKNGGAIFLNELAKSYFILENYELVILTYYRQRCFFPIKNDAESKKYYYNSAERIRKNNFSLLINNFNNTNFSKIPKSQTARFEMFLKLVYKSGFKNTDIFEQKYSELFSVFFSEKELPYWIEQQNFYSKIGINPQKRKNLYSFEKRENNLFIPDFLNKKEKKNICHKALRYLLKNKNKTKIKEYISFCKKNNINYCLRAKIAVKN